MNKLIFVGDPHAQPSNLKDCEKIIELVIETQQKEQASTLVLAGDLFHTHAVLRLEVVNFWKRAATLLSKQGFSKIYALVGNHDMAGDKQTEHKMSALDVLKDIPGVVVVDRPISNGYNMGFLPYYSDNTKFIEATKEAYELGARILFCHQTFDGSKFDNGFYAPGGVDQNLLPAFDQIVSGHIHTSQTIGKVFYPGTPKWDTLSDANEDKGIWVLSDSWKFISIAEKIEPIVSLTINEQTDLDSVKVSKRTTLELEGSSTWIASVSKKLKGSCRLVARPTDAKTRQENTEQSLDIWHFVEKSSLSCDKILVRSYLEGICR